MSRPTNGIRYWLKTTNPCYYTEDANKTANASKFGMMITALVLEWRHPGIIQRVKKIQKFKISLAYHFENDDGKWNWTTPTKPMAWLMKMGMDDETNKQ